MSDKTHSLSTCLPYWASFPSISLPICRHSVTVSKTRTEAQLKNWSYYPVLVEGHGHGWRKGMDRCRSKGQSWNKVPRWRMALWTSHHPGSHSSSHFILTSALGHHPASPSWGTGQTNPHGVWIQSPMSPTGKHSGLWVVFDEFDPSRPTYLMNLMTSDHCCYHFFHRVFLIVAGINIS